MMKKDYIIKLTYRKRAIGDVSKMIKDTQGCYIIILNSNNVASKIKLALNYPGKTNGREKIKNLCLDKVEIYIMFIKMLLHR